MEKTVSSIGMTFISKFAKRFILAACLLLATGYSYSAERPLAPEDLYLLDGPQSVVAIPGSKRAAMIRRWVDEKTKDERFSLWLVEGSKENAKAIEADEPDARAVTPSPDGRWLAVRSTRPRPQGWKQTPPVPSESDPATDIWLVPVDGSRAIPLAGPKNTYGRVFIDPFYGRVSFSPDGKRLAFVADDGVDPRTPDELEAGVEIVRTDQGEGYTGYRPAQIWIAELDADPKDTASTQIRRLTNDEVWYGDPQWTPDGKTIICHANKSSDIESVRFSINKNYDLWAIDVETGSQRRLTFGPGAEVSPRISADGRQLVCVSSPRRGPHADVFNLLVVSLPEDARAKPEARVLYDHHAEQSSHAPHPAPAFPLPDVCWNGQQSIVYTTSAGLQSQHVRVDLQSSNGTVIDLKSDAGAEPGPALAKYAAEKELSPQGNRAIADRLQAEERIVKWTNEGWDLEGVLLVPPSPVARAPFPLVVFPHGGPHGKASAGFNFTAHVLAARGYAVFQPNFRGSAGYGRKFLDADREDLGGGVGLDVLAGRHHDEADDPEKE